MQEQDIIELLLQRNEKGMDALLLHYGPLMRYIIAPILQNPQDQEDCLSEVAMRVWKKIEQFNQERGSWKTWLTAITRNAALNYTMDTHRHLRLITLCASYRPRTGCCFIENIITYNQQPKLLPSWG